LVPWDIETFGFGVADYETDELETNSLVPSQISQHLEAWSKAHEVELVGTTVPASNSSKLYFLQLLGFRYIDTTLVVRYERVQSTNYPSAEITLTPADKNDLTPVIQICGQAFKNGRYHADPCFPRQLADKRYQQWASRTFDPENPQVLLVAKMNDQVCAFSIVQTDGEQGYLHLNAVHPQWQGKRIGIGLIASTMRYFQQRSVSVVTLKISASNMPAVNLHVSLGARFYDPQILLHWHAPWSTHLKK
jgi:ribosomal protein S18 acetylase RimI-like enzyme